MPQTLNIEELTAVLSLRRCLKWPKRDLGALTQVVTKNYGSSMLANAITSDHSSSGFNGIKTVVVNAKIVTAEKQRLRVGVRGQGLGLLLVHHCR